jgi:hypothetical protein
MLQKSIDNDTLVVYSRHFPEQPLIARTLILTNKHKRTLKHIFQYQYKTADCRKNSIEDSQEDF